ncbi:MAG: serine/threonine protein kinase, partial [Methylococcaceae bacterium]|nr:serine/threonine protein kinase [Methylococcaceae bacterium]
MNEIGNYRILKKLGEGGMGEVFMGEDIMLERKVAIKVLRPELSQREDILQRFRSEAVALGRLNHPNIATVYTFAKDGEHYYLAMEFVNGEPLDTVINKRGKLIWQDAVCYTCDALAGLEHAHRLNVIHRDIKPANIMLTHTGGVKLVDFGIARILEQARQTRTGYLIGTLEYISPEQVQGLDVDA